MRDQWNVKKAQYDELHEQADAAAQYVFGMLVGFKDGFVGTVEGGWSLVKRAWNATKYVVKLPWRASNAMWANVFGNGTDNFKREFAKEVQAVEKTGAVAKQVAEERPGFPLERGCTQEVAAIARRERLAEIEFAFGLCREKSLEHDNERSRRTWRRHREDISWRQRF